MEGSTPKNSFVLYTKYVTQIEKLDDFQRGVLFLAIMRYQCGLELPDMDPVVDMLFSVIKEQMDADTQKYEETCAKRSEAGRKGADKTNRQKAANAENADSAKRQKSAKAANAGFAENEERQKPANSPDSESESDSESDSDKAYKTAQCARVREDDAFEVFWKAYPKKVGKSDCRQIWEKLRPSKELFAKIMSTLSAASASDQWTREGHRFVPNPATWLRQGRWDDDVGSYPRNIRDGPKTRFHNLDERRNDDLEDYALKKMISELEEDDSG